MEKRMMFRWTLVLFLGCLMPWNGPAVAGDEAALSTDWPRFRGPSQDGISPAKGVFPDHEFGLEVVWRKPLGSGYSGISIADGRLVTLYSNGADDILIAMDPSTGDPLWEFVVGPTYRGHDGSDDGPISTPTLHEGVVYGLGPHGDLFAVRLADGGKIWSKNVVEDLGGSAPFYGFATPPVVSGDVLIVQTGGTGGLGAVRGLDRHSGKTLWSSGDDGVGYQSPLLKNFDADHGVLAATSHHLLGLVPETGEVLFDYQHYDGRSQGWSQPIPMGDHRVLLNYWNDAALIEFIKEGEAYKVQEVWRTLGFKSNYAIPVYHEGYLYGFSNRILTCVNSQDGTVVWRSREPGGRGLILVDGHLVIAANHGALVVAEASPQGYREKARLHRFEQESYTAPSFAMGRIFFRNLTEIASLQVVGSSPVAAEISADVAVSRGAFGDFVRSLGTAENKRKAVDDFMNSQETFPIIEDRGLVHIVYRGEVKDLALVGNMLRRGESLPLQRVGGTDLHYVSLQLEEGGHWAYQLQIDFGDSEADPLNARSFDSPDGPKSEIVMPGWPEPRHLEQAADRARGRIERFDFTSAIRGNEREIAVYLPPGYDEGSRRYPLLIVNSGDRALRFGKMDVILDNLIGTQVEPLIVAFLPRRSSREHGGAQALEYTRLIVEEVLPHLESTYRTEARASSRGIMGTGDGALAAAYTAFKKPGLFSKFATQSLLLRSNTTEDLFSLIRDGEKQPLKIYMDWSRREVSRNYNGADPTEDNERLFAVLDQGGYGVQGGAVLDGAGWASWRSRLDKILTTLFPLR